MVFLNGARIGSGGGNWGDIDVPLDRLRQGRNQLAIRVVNPAASGDPNRGGLSGHVDFSIIAGSLNLAEADLVVLSSRLLLSFWSAATLEEHVRQGGAVLALMHDAARRWEDSPIERMLPTCLGLSSALAGTVRPIPAGTLAGVIDRDADPLQVTASILLPSHPNFARPGTRETARWNLSPLAWDHRIEVVGDDPKASPLLTSAQYGAGVIVACAAPALFEPARIRGILARAGEGLPGNTPSLGKVWSAAGLPADHLIFQGLEPSEQDDADVVIVGGATAAQQVRDAVSGGKTALVLDPDILADHPDLNPWSQEIRTPATPFPLMTQEAWSSITQRGEPRTVRIACPPGSSHQLCIKEGPYGSVRGIWTAEETGRRCVDGSWVISPAASLQVGVWTDVETEVPIVHAGDRAIVVTGTGIRLGQPLNRPGLRRPVGEVLWRWEDGEPALAVRQVGSGRVASFSVPLEWQDPRRLDWSDVHASKSRFLSEDSAQLPALAARQLVSSDLTLGPVETTASGVTVGLGATPRPVQVRYRFRDWQRSLLSSRSVDLAPQRERRSVTIPWPDDEVRSTYEAAEQCPSLWLEVAVVSEPGDRCLSHLELAVQRPGPLLSVWHTPLSRRAPQRLATWPRTADPEFPREQGPAGQYPLFVPGEDITLLAETWAPGAREAEVRVQDLIHGREIDIASVPLRRSAGPWRVTEWRMPAPAPSLYRVEASLDGVVASSMLVVSTPTDLRSASWDKAKGVQVLGTLLPYCDEEQFAVENLCAHADSGLAWGPFAHSRAGQPWCDFLPNPFSILPNGIRYRTWISPTIRSLARHTWTGETLTISASLVDGFNGVPWPPAFVHPQHLAAFARWKAGMGGGDLRALPADSLAALALGPLAAEWRFFVATEIALPAHRIVKDELQAASPGSNLTDQFDLPLLPTLLRIPDVERFAESWQDLFALSSSDAWNIRAGRDYHAATYLVCLGKALAPRSRIGHYHMEMLGGIGPERIAKAELIRRQNADLFWMMAASDWGWVPVESYADGGGVSWLGGWQTWLPLSSKSLRGGHVAFPEDWQALQRLYAMAEAVRPQRPRGFTLAAVGPRMPAGEEVIMGDQARLFGMLRETGLVISSMARLDKISLSTVPDGIIVPVPGELTVREREGLQLCVDEGIPVGVIGLGLSEDAIAAYTGITGSQLNSPPFSLLRGGNVRGPFWPDGTDEDYRAVAEFARDLRQRCAFDVSAAEGVSSYAFEGSHGLMVVLLEERGEARTVVVTLRTQAKGTHAAEFLRGRPLVVRHTERGPVVEVPLAAAGAALVQISYE
jgi:hypothetical protein